MDSPDLLDQFNTPSYYVSHFMDPQVWQPYVQRVCKVLEFTVRHVQPGLPGTYPTFIVSVDAGSTRSTIKSIVVKFFGPLFDGTGAFATEKIVALTLADHPLGIRLPQILAQGEVTKEWSYLVFEYVPGVSLSEVRAQLSAGALMELAAQMGDFLRELHEITVEILPSHTLPGYTMTWERFPDFIEKQLQQCIANHQKWNDLPGQLFEQLPAYLLPAQELIDPAMPPHLIHADLTADHVLGWQVGSSWQTLAIIDWGDARLGNIMYELVALHLDLFQGDVRLLKACLDAYHLPDFYQQDFPHKAFNMVLLHQFPMPAEVYAPYQHVSSLDELAECLFGVKP